MNARCAKNYGKRKGKK